MNAPALVGVDIAKDSFDSAVGPHGQIWSFANSRRGISDLCARLGNFPVS